MTLHSVIRIMVVDDSVVNRQMLARHLNAIAGFEVVALASNGKLALEKLPYYKPDLVILDVEMPVMDGLETLEKIREQDSQLPVIMFSTLTETGAAVTFQALAKGASDYVTKPGTQLQPEDQGHFVVEAFENRIRALVYSGQEQHPPPQVVAPAPLLSGRATGRKLAVVGIGVSTGGPNALAELIPQLPASFPLPVVIVQHMPPLFTRYLAERLDALSPLTVLEAEDGMCLQVGHVYIAPGNHHLLLRKSAGQVLLQLNQGPYENSCRPSVDVLFRSLVECFEASVLGVILTGMGHDGLKGCELIQQAGGLVMVQDAASSTIWGMPGSVAKAGLAHKIVSLSAMATEITHCVAGSTVSQYGG